jgi:hypothetical protein
VAGINRAGKVVTLKVFGPRLFRALVTRSSNFYFHDCFALDSRINFKTLYDVSGILTDPTLRINLLHLGVLQTSKEQINLFLSKKNYDNNNTKA